MNGPLMYTPTLREAQQWMAAEILGVPSDTVKLDALIVTPQRGEAAERIGIYAGGYPARIEEALKETFPAVEHIVGESAFHDLVHRYVEAVPLGSYNLNDAGAELSQFLSTDRLTAGLPFLPDLARLEWEVARAFHAHDQPSFDPAPLANWGLDDWEGVALRFQSWVAVVRSDWPIREIWECRETPIAEIDIDLNNRPDRVLVRRSGYAVVCESLDAPEAGALDALRDGQTLGSVIATLASRGHDAPAVSSWFTRWMALRMICPSLLRHEGQVTRREVGDGRKQRV